MTFYYPFHRFRPKWGLSAGPSTQFKREPGPEKIFEKFRRKVTEIAELPNFRTNVRWSDEFDTVGIVVKKTITETDQEVWLADVKQKQACDWLLSYHGNSCVVF